MICTGCQAAYDRTVRICGPNSGDELATLSDHTSPVLAVAVTADGSRIISGGDDCTVRIWDTGTATSSPPYE